TEIGIVNGDVDDSEEYAKAMGDFAEAFEGLIEELGDLIALADEFEDEEDIEVWANTFVLIKDSIGYCVEMLAEAMEEVPEEYVESHLNITLAVSAVYDAMTSFQDAVDAAIEGDEDAFLEGMTTFVELFEAADELWNEAVI
ncbi:MAG: hypothetical protein FWH07_01865, partial [Oscillospiraceae bacterium]|nr:hypothetical protein [Oscillospiraceae bacterium]